MVAGGSELRGGIELAGETEVKEPKMERIPVRSLKLSEFHVDIFRELLYVKRVIVCFSVGPFRAQFKVLTVI